MDTIPTFARWWLRRSIVRWYTEARNSLPYTSRNGGQPPRRLSASVRTNQIATLATTLLSRSPLSAAHGYRRPRNPCCPTPEQTKGAQCRTDGRSTRLPLAERKSQNLHRVGYS